MKADGKVENQKQVSHFPIASVPFLKDLRAGLLARRCAPPMVAAGVVNFSAAAVVNFHFALDTGRRIWLGLGKTMRNVTEPVVGSTVTSRNCIVPLDG